MSKPRKQQAPPEPQPVGRPTLYTPELAAEICRRLADGESLRKICEAEAMPDESTVRLWVVEDRDGFYTHYTRARQAQALKWADEVVDIADDSTFDAKMTENGIVVDGEAIARARLRVDTRKWILSKVLPKVYGDKVIHEGNDDAPLTIRIVRG